MFYNLCFLFSLCEQVIIKRWGTLTDFGKFHPPQKNPPSVFIYLITKLSDNLTEPIDDYCHGHFELLNFILAQKLTEKGQLILQLLHPSRFVPTSTVIREMRVEGH